MSIKLFNNKGDSFKFLNSIYNIGTKERLKVGDEVIIHPVKANNFFSTTGFTSQATKSYPAKIVVKEIQWIKVPHKYSDYNIMNPKHELCLQGTGENKNWHGAILNKYGFSRLEFVRRTNI